MKKLFAFITILSIGNLFAQSVGIGTVQFVPKSTLDVAGGVTIGADYAGVSAAPTNGLIVEGFIGAACNSATSPLTINYHPTTHNPAISVSYWPSSPPALGVSAIFQGLLVPNPTGNDPTAIYVGEYNALNPISNYTIGAVAGIYNYYSGCCTGTTINNVYGLYNEFGQHGLGHTVTNQYGVYSNLGGLANYSAVYGEYIAANGFGNITSGYGLYVDDLASKVTGTAYGVYCVGNQLNYFGGNVGIGSTNPGFKLDVNGHANIATNMGYWIGGNKILFVDGTLNLFCGANAAPSNTGSNNTFVGALVAQNNISGSDNVELGFGAGFRNVAGSYNIYLGWGSAYDINGGSHNIIIGWNTTYFGAGARPLNGSVIIGDYSGRNVTGDNNVIIGNAADATGGGVTNSIAIGNGANVTSSNTCILGNTSVVATGINGGVPTVGTDAIMVGSYSGTFNVGTNGNGASLTKGGTWTNTSSVKLKEDFSRLEGQDVLNKIMNLNVSKWRYKNTNEYHIGPIAEEFYSAFQTGNDNIHISTVDPAGVALIAIQELYRQLKKKDKEIQDLKIRLDKLENK